MKFSRVAALSFAVCVSARPMERRANGFTKQNGVDAIALK